MAVAELAGLPSTEGLPPFAIKYLREYEVLYDNRVYSVAAVMAERHRSATCKQVTSPRQALVEFPRRVEALVQRIVLNSVGGRSVSVIPLPTRERATPAEAVPCQKYDNCADQSDAANVSTDRLWRKIEFEYRGIGRTNTIPISDCILCARSPFPGLQPAGYMKSWATFGVSKDSLKALGKRAGLAIGNRTIRLPVVRYDLGDDRYFWFDIPFRSDGFSFVRGDDGDGVSNEQVTSLPCADDHAGSQSNVPCTLLLDVGCSVVIAGGDPPEDVDTGRMWGVHLGMMKCILTMPSGGNTKAKGKSTGAIGLYSGPEAPSAAADFSADKSERQEPFPRIRSLPRWSSRRYRSRTLSAVSEDGFGEIPSLKSWKFWFCCHSVFTIQKG